MRAAEFGCLPLNGRLVAPGVRAEQIGIARDAVVVGLAAEGIGVDGEIAAGGIEQRGAVEAVVDGRSRRRASRSSTQPDGLRWAPAALVISAVGAGRPRVAAGRKRIGDAVVGRAHHAADRLRAVAQGGRSADHLDLVGGQRIDRARNGPRPGPRRRSPPMPFSTMPTRLTSRPRMIGRLDAPGAKLDPVMPGL